jgi:hypothetical protein
MNVLVKGHFAFHRGQKSDESLESTDYLFVLRRCEQEGVAGTQGNQAPIVEVKIRSVERKIEAFSVSRIVQSPLAHSEDNCQAVPAR